MEPKNYIKEEISKLSPLICGLEIKDVYTIPENYFIDFGYAYSVTGSYYQPYTLSSKDVPSIITKQYDNRFLITLGYNF